VTVKQRMPVAVQSIVVGLAALAPAMITRLKLPLPLIKTLQFPGPACSARGKVTLSVIWTTDAAAASTHACSVLHGAALAATANSRNAHAKRPIETIATHYKESCQLLTHQMLDIRCLNNIGA
jgi:hypothetical protein